MKTQIILIALTAFCLNACIAGPTPHPANDSAYEPNVSAEMDASLGAVNDMVDGHEAHPPNADATGSVDAAEEDGQTEDTNPDEDAVSNDSISSDVATTDEG